MKMVKESTWYHLVRLLTTSTILNKLILMSELKAFHQLCGRLFSGRLAIVRGSKVQTCNFDTSINLEKLILQDLVAGAIFQRSVQTTC